MWDTYPLIPLLEMMVLIGQKSQKLFKTVILGRASQLRPIYPYVIVPATKVSTYSVLSPWSPEFSPEQPQLSTVVVPVDFRGVPCLLFNRQSLSRIATAVGKPVSLAPETERKENFEVAKVWVRVDLLADLPKKIVSGFSNGRENEIDVSYPWLPKKCDKCGKFGHDQNLCPADTNAWRPKHQALNHHKPPPPSGRSRSRESKGRNRSRPSRSVRKQRLSQSESHGTENVKEADQVSTTVDASNDQVLAVVEVHGDSEVCIKNAITTDGSVSVSDPGNITSDLEKLLRTKEPIIPCASLNHERVSHEAMIDKGQQDEIKIDASNDVAKPSPSKQVVTLDRNMGFSTVHVYHEDDVSTSTALCGKDDTSEAPFFLVNNRKSSRKATKA
ncbi:hypothetical protein YC2023_079258 [Brassica napus]